MKQERLRRRKVKGSRSSPYSSPPVVVPAEFTVKKRRRTVMIDYVVRQR